jgi:hypothetical protein
MIAAATRIKAEKAAKEGSQQHEPRTKCDQETADILQQLADPMNRLKQKKQKQENKQRMVPYQPRGRGY